MINLLLSVVVGVFAALILIIWLFRKKEISQPNDIRYDFSSIQNFIRDALQELVSANLHEENLNVEEFNRRKKRKNELKKALRNCKHGDIPAKKFVKLVIKDILLQTYGFNDKNVNLLIPFDKPEQLSAQDQFDILLYLYQKEHGYDALSTIIKNYNLDALKGYPDGSEGYRITASEIKEIYIAENPKLSFDDKINIIVQRVYQGYKGLGVIDEIRDMNIDGVNGGTSGLPPDIRNNLDLYEGDEKLKFKPKSHDSVWIFYKGKPIHLEFLSFGSELEIKRVCQNIYTFGSPGQLNESKPYIINDMADGSRVVVARPKMGENWAFWVRKFNDELLRLEDLIKGENAEILIQLLIFIIKGELVTAITGHQGVGKTKLLLALIGYINRTYNIRVLETAFELRAKRLYPDHNIFTIRETETVTGQEGLDFLKKTDGTVNILGEVATHPVASYLIQLAMVAFRFTLFTHHGKTFPNLVSALVNSLIADGAYSDHKIAEKHVVSVLNIDIHLAMTYEGERYIERVTECIPLEEMEEYPRGYIGTDELYSKWNASMDTIREYFTRSTDRKTYTYQDIMVWDNGKYVVKNRLTDRTIENMERNMKYEDRQAFKAFLQEHWGEAS
jgi:pilus assembly protein CpaF